MTWTNSVRLNGCHFHWARGVGAWGPLGPLSWNPRSNTVYWWSFLLQVPYQRMSLSEHFTSSATSHVDGCVSSFPLTQLPNPGVSEQSHSPPVHPFVLMYLKQLSFLLTQVPCPRMSNQNQDQRTWGSKHVICAPRLIDCWLCVAPPQLPRFCWLEHLHCRCLDFWLTGKMDCFTTATQNSPNTVLSLFHFRCLGF